MLIPRSAKKKTGSEAEVARCGNVCLSETNAAITDEA